MSVHKVHEMPRGQRRALDPLGVREGCKLPCGCWELNLGPLEAQLVFLTTEQLSSPQVKIKKGNVIRKLDAVK